VLIVSRCVAIGICDRRANTYSLPGHPGSNAYGYHSDDAKIYTMSISKAEHSRRVFGTDDKVGCVLRQEGATRTIRFTHNGEKIGTPSAIHRFSVRAQEPLTGARTTTGHR
jgi:hypothetical protein